ncbi:MAG: ComEC/Rec2 family competence protein [Janthinobacterium lividum]
MRDRPLLVWSAAFAGGIVVGAEGWLPPVAAFCVAALGLGALMARRWLSLFPLALLLLGVSVGALRLAAFQTVALSDVSHRADRPYPVTVIGMVGSDPEDRPGGRVTFFLRAARAESQGQSALVTGEVSVTVGPEAARGLRLDYGDQVQLEGLLETPEAATNPGAFSWREYLARRAVFCQMNVKRVGAASVLGAGVSNPFLEVAWHVRKAAVSAIEHSLPATEAAVLSGILIGRRTDLPPGLMVDFIHTGTVHILASAGLHVGILAFWLEKLLHKLTLPRKLQALILIVCLVLFALVCGGRPAVVRAVLMASLYFGAILFEREPDGPTAIGAAGLLILLLQPTALLEPGFQLSFLTILTLAMTMPVWNEFWRPRLSAKIKQPVLHKAALWAVEGIGVSWLAQLGAMPVVAASYNEVSLSGWLANLLVVPLLFGLIPLGIIGILLDAAWHSGGEALLAVAGLGIDGILHVVRGLGEVSWSYQALPSPPLPLVLLFYVLVYSGTDAAHRLLRKVEAPE